RPVPSPGRQGGTTVPGVRRLLFLAVNVLGRGRRCPAAARLRPGPPAGVPPAGPGRAPVGAAALAAAESVNRSPCGRRPPLFPCGAGATSVRRHASPPGSTGCVARVARPLSAAGRRRQQEPVGALLAPLLQ